MIAPMQVPLREVLSNNRSFLKDSFQLSEEEYLDIMSTIGPSSAFKSKYKSHRRGGSFTQWDPSNPTRGWCAQMTRFLRDYCLIPKGYVAYCDENRDHYYFINDQDKIIDLTIYQAGYSKPGDLVPYHRIKAMFNLVKAKSTKDAMRLYEVFKKYMKK